jgi:hypothetical protein
MYFGRSYQAAVEGKILRHHECPCGFSAQATVEARGRATAESPFMLSNALSRRLASQDAGHAAARHAAMTMWIVRCPACGKRDPRGVRRYWLRAGGRLIGSAVLLAGLGALLSWSGASRAVGLLAVGGGVLYLGWSFVTDALWTWRTADARVDFGSAPKQA